MIPNLIDALIVVVFMSLLFFLASKSSAIRSRGADSAGERVPPPADRRPPLIEPRALDDLQREDNLDLARRK